MTSQKILAFSFLCSFISCTENKNTVGEDETNIRNVRLQSNEAIARGDSTGVARVWTNDYHLISSRNFEVSGLERNRHWFAKEFSSKEEVRYVRTTANVEVFSEWNMASENGTWTGQWREKDGLVKFTGTYFAKWHKQNDEWKIRAEIFVPLTCSGSSFCSKKPF